MPMKLRELMEMRGPLDVLEAGDDANGWTPYRNAGLSEARQLEMLDLQDLFEGISNGRRIKDHVRSFYLKEAISTTDFPDIFSTILDRQLLTRFRLDLGIMRVFFKVRSVRDFRTIRRIRPDGAEAILAEVEKGGEYRQDTLASTTFDYTVAKRGKIFSLVWEDLVDDSGDLDIFADLPGALARSARASEDKFLTELWVVAGGWAAITTWEGGQDAIDTLVFNIANLTTAIEEMMAFTTPVDNNPIAPPERLTLMVPPALALTAQQVVNSVEVRSTEALTSGGGLFGIQSPLAGVKIRISVNPWLPLVANTGSPIFGSTMWALVRDPDDGVPAGEFGRLRGHEEPEIFMQTSDQRRITGGTGSFEDGDFDRDAVRLKVRYVFGGRAVDGRAIWVSNGQ